jgi:hypothetical protein
MATALKTFAEAQSELASATSAIRNAHSTLRHAVSAIKIPDSELNRAIEELARAIVGAGMGTRARPFAGFSKRAPSKLARMAYARKVAATRAVARKLHTKKLPAPVRAASEALGAQADAVARALGGVTLPAAALHGAQGALGPALAAWRAAYARLKVLAAAAWIDDPVTLRAMFEKPDRLQVPARKKRRASVRASGGEREAEDQHVDDQTDRDEAEAHDR